MKTAAYGTVLADKQRRIRLPDEFYSVLDTANVQWVMVGRRLVLEPQPPADVRNIRRWLKRITAISDQEWASSQCDDKERQAEAIMAHTPLTRSGADD
jgi:hypothetical protein